jgi:GT2 family glycosyltransferase
LNPSLTVVVPTHDRPDALSETLAAVSRQSMSAAEYEVVVVDDGSSPPVRLPPRGPELPGLSLLRLEGVERSAARNAGAGAARGELLVFLDDDMSVGPDFLAAHAQAQREWPGALAVGAVFLPAEVQATPFGRFRAALERDGIPQARGPTPKPNFCTAQNMSISSARFRDLGGFSTQMSSSEDQDLALRHSASGGRIVFLPEALAIHRDASIDLRSYCRRTEWGMEHMLPFIRRHADWPDNREREAVNGPVRWAQEPLRRSLAKTAKAILGRGPLRGALFRAAWALESAAPDSPILDRVYRLLLGVHLLRGYRRGLRRYGHRNQSACGAGG